MRRLAPAVLLAAAVAVLLPAAGGTRAIREGGTFRMAIPSTYIDSVDPAIAALPGDFPVLEPTCLGS
jgi:hypothetical protein